MGASLLALAKCIYCGQKKSGVGQNVDTKIAAVVNAD